MEYLHHIGLVIGVIGVAVIVWGVVLGVFKLVALEIRRIHSDNLREREGLRHHLAYYLLLGLEFLVAADIVDTIINPKLDDLYVLGGIVLIRTVISFSINWELAQSAKLYSQDHGK